MSGNTGNDATAAEQGYNGTFAAFQSQFGTNLSSYVGAWGVNTTGNEAWAVLNHASEFAVVPEPSAWTLLAIGGVALCGLAISKRRARRAAQSASQAIKTATPARGSHYPFLNCAASSEPLVALPAV